MRRSGRFWPDQDNRLEAVADEVSRDHIRSIDLNLAQSQMNCAEDGADVE